MKRLLFTLMAVMALSVSAKDIKELVVTTTPPMSCQNCENRIKKNLRWEKGVKDIETNLPEQRVIVSYDAEKTTPEKIEAAFGKIGYSVEVINQTGETESTPGSCENKPECCGNKCCGN